MNYSQYLREKITSLRLEKNISEYQLSLEIGKSKTYIQAITSGKSLLSFDAFFDLCEYFNLTPEEFFTQDKNDTAQRRNIRNKVSELYEEDLALVEQLVERLAERKEP
ncbi:MAG: helix-turn-helix transcriptional regulator [Lachnospiraceae bacterium]|nr:helix-turn-helix transcriptional regulator [Lachnospiraceae bacterium]